MFNGSIGPLELIVVLVIVLVIFGPKRLPSLGRQLGRGMREFKDSITGDSKGEDDEDAERPTITAAAEDPPRTPADAATPATSEDPPRTPADAEQTRA